MTAACSALEPSGHFWHRINLCAKNVIAKLRASQTIDDATAGQVLRVFRDDSDVLAGTTVLPVYWDVNLDNFIADERFKLKALVDLENVGLTSLDYPLFVIQKLIDEPEKYQREEDEGRAGKKDYARLRDWYRVYYPEMFAFSERDTRVKLYQLLDTMDLLIDWRHVLGLYEKLDDLIS